ncbi:MAG: thioesterase family protein [Actinomycetota bacterium]
MAYTHTIRPRYAEVDMQGVVFNAHWLTYFDEAVTRYFEAIGFDPKVDFFEGGAFDVMVVKAVLEWRGPAGFDDNVSIAVSADRIGTKSFDMRLAASVEGRAACDGVITYVCVTHGTNESRQIPPVLRDKLAMDGAVTR